MCTEGTSGFVKVPWGHNVPGFHANYFGWTCFPELLIPEPRLCLGEFIPGIQTCPWTCGHCLQGLSCSSQQPRGHLCYIMGRRKSVIMERRLSGHFPEVWRQVWPRWLQPSCRIGSARAAVLGCSFLGILHSPLSVVWVSKLHLSLKNME